MWACTPDHVQHQPRLDGMLPCRQTVCFSPDSAVMYGDAIVTATCQPWLQRFDDNFREALLLLPL